MKEELKKLLKKYLTIEISQEQGVFMTTKVDVYFDNELISSDECSDLNRHR